MATTQSILPLKRDPLGRSALLRFFRMIKRPRGGKPGCWLWCGSKSKTGHGRFRIDGKLYLPHRVMFRQFVGAIRRRLVLHKCDNPACVNPAHLFLGTQLDNLRDASRKGRLRKRRRTA